MSPSGSLSHILKTFSFFYVNHDLLLTRDGNSNLKNQFDIHWKLGASFYFDVTSFSDAVLQIQSNLTVQLQNLRL